MYILVGLVIALVGLDKFWYCRGQSQVLAGQLLWGKGPSTEECAFGIWWSCAVSYMHDLSMTPTRRVCLGWGPAGAALRALAIMGGGIRRGAGWACCTYACGADAGSCSRRGHRRAWFGNVSGVGDGGELPEVTACMRVPRGSADDCRQSPSAAP